MVGSSMPARRPFFKPVAAVPALVAQATNSQVEREVFENVIPGGWAPENSAVRITASALAVLAALSFAFVATLCAERRTRVCFGVMLGLIAAVGAVATALDAWQLTRAAMECSARKCTEYVPSALKLTTATCKCAPDGWFWVTLAVDVVLLTAALACLGLTLRPLFVKR